MGLEGRLVEVEVGRGWRNAFGSSFVGQAGYCLCKEIVTVTGPASCVVRRVSFVVRVDCVEAGLKIKKKKGESGKGAVQLSRHGPEQEKECY